MNYIKLLITLYSILFISSCNQEPNAYQSGQLTAESLYLKDGQEFMPKDTTTYLTYEVAEEIIDGILNKEVMSKLNSQKRMQFMQEKFYDKDKKFKDDFRKGFLDYMKLKLKTNS